MDGDGFAAPFDGTVELAQGALYLGEVAADRCQLRIGLGNLFQQHQSLLGLAGLVLQQGDHVQRVGVAGILTEDFAVEAFGIGQAAGAMGFEGLVEEGGAFLEGDEHEGGTSAIANSGKWEWSILPVGHGVASPEKSSGELVKRVKVIAKKEPPVF